MRHIISKGIILMKDTDYIIKRLEALNCPTPTLITAFTSEFKQKSLEVLKANPKITLDEFLEKTGIPLTE